MKIKHNKLLTILLNTMALLTLTVFFSCQEKEGGNTLNSSKQLIQPENPLNKLKYDNTIDFFCKMDITRYGVSDTLHYKGKLYGFCSKMCKDEFRKNPDSYLTDKTVLEHK
ncbi:YHS domain-containing protein [Flavobacterium cerinum]|uniref:YHS domain-containing protein n=1 Tax=Flavobacterium cerinum TaxID=2502784 RepID=A0ABY5IXD3_9FLAO|nr:YHS domain-containing protein [Flavobacterium cerinum]UUC46009.1 YHS domain-containing protein [Flavobacterium cerinum]